MGEDGYIGDNNPERLCEEHPNGEQSPMYPTGQLYGKAESLKPPRQGVEITPEAVDAFLSEHSPDYRKLGADSQRKCSERICETAPRVLTQHISGLDDETLDRLGSHANSRAAAMQTRDCEHCGHPDALPHQHGTDDAWLCEDVDACCGRFGSPTNSGTESLQTADRREGLKRIGEISQRQIHRDSEHDHDGEYDEAPSCLFHGRGEVGDPCTCPSVKTYTKDTNTVTSEDGMTPAQLENKRFQYGPADAPCVIHVWNDGEVDIKLGDPYHDLIPAETMQLVVDAWLEYTEGVYTTQNDVSDTTQEAPASGVRYWRDVPGVVEYDDVTELVYTVIAAADLLLEAGDREAGEREQALWHQVQKLGTKCGELQAALDAYRNASREQLDECQHLRDDVEKRDVIIDWLMTRQETDNAIVKDTTDPLLQDDAREDLLHWAWSIIANGHDGDWDAANPEWRAAAEEFRHQYHAHIERSHKPESTITRGCACCADSDAMRHPYMSMNQVEEFTDNHKKLCPNTHENGKMIE